ncbi:hypothetical protein BJV77DRAFT_516695 [Russula vinacea]|nr:hypothetical protein BJV77DRAFT_516695 [Russula vinacea]
MSVSSNVTFFIVPSVCWSSHPRRTTVKRRTSDVRVSSKFREKPSKFELLPRTENSFDPPTSATDYDADLDLVFHGTKNCSDVDLDNAAAPSSFNYSEPQTVAFLGSTSDSAGLAVRCPKTDASLQALPSPPSVKVPSPILGAADCCPHHATPPTLRLGLGHQPHPSSHAPDLSLSTLFDNKEGDKASLKFRK